MHRLRVQQRVNVYCGSHRNVQQELEIQVANVLIAQWIEPLFPKQEIPVRLWLGILYHVVAQW